MKTKEDSSVGNPQQTIIQCPGCQTKFAVEASAISQLDFPRFHCSRCDNVFGLDESSKFRPQVVEESVESQQDRDEEDFVQHVSTQQREEPEQDEYVGEEKEEVNPILHATVSQPDPSPRYEAKASLPSAQPTQVSEPAPSTSLYRGLEIPKQYDKAIQSIAPRETETVEVIVAPTTRREKPKDPLKDQMELQFSSTHFGKPSAISDENLANSNASPYRSIAEALAKERAEIYSARASARKDEKESATKSSIGPISKITPPSADADYPKLFDNAFVKENQVKRFAFGGGQNSSSALFFALPIVGVLMCLALLGSYLKNNVGVGARFASILFSPPAKVAPAGLVIKNPKYKKLTLESGEDVRLISGTLVNSSTESFRSVKLEGLAFDDSGHPLTNIKVDASSSLAKTRVKSLSVDMIKSMQAAAAPKRYELKPGDSQDFEMALVDDASARARYFSARIYSVK